MRRFPIIRCTIANGHTFTDTFYRHVSQAIASLPPTLTAGA
ncbi:MAG: hypothetical protein AAF215_06465 [Cyanobacteria bacterium P01_A01_bin.123]